MQGSVVAVMLGAAATVTGAGWTTAGFELDCDISSVQGSVVLVMLGAAATVTGADWTTAGFELDCGISVQGSSVVAGFPETFTMLTAPAGAW